MPCFDDLDIETLTAKALSSTVRYSVESYFQRGHLFHFTGFYSSRVTEDLVRLTELKLKLARCYKLIRKLLLRVF
jgi:hypothetical protein